MDLTDTIAPTSDQLDAVDLLSGPRTFTIKGVKKGSAEQPVQIELAEFPRVWRPGKSMRRVLVKAWGPDASKYVGRRVTLYCDPDVKFGGEKVGGTRISHLSHIDGPVSTPLLVTRGKSAMFTVQPLAESAPAVTDEQIAAAQSLDELRALWSRADEVTRAKITARKAELESLTGTPAAEPVASSESTANAQTAMAAVRAALDAQEVLDV